MTTNADRLSAAETRVVVLLGNVAKLRTTTERVGALHVNTGDAWGPECGYCLEPWPCTTEKITRDALEGETR